MSDGTEHTLYLIPPHGPLCWVYPELAGLASLQPADDSRMAGKTDCQLLDLSVSSLTGASLLDEIDARHPQEIRVEDGPRGYALWSWLRQALRGKDVRVIRPHSSADLVPHESRDADPRTPSLEALLASASGHLGAGDYLVETGASPQSRARARAIQLSPTPSPGRQDGLEKSRRSLLLLPLTEDAGLARRLNVVLDAVSADPAGFREAGIVPFFVTRAPACAPGAKGVETRPPISCWGLLPGEVYPAPVRERYRELVRLLHPGRIFLFLALENYCLAGIDLYTEGLMDRFGPFHRLRPPLRPQGISAERGRKDVPLIIGVCGTDGSGKSSHVQALIDHLSGLGLKVKRHKICRHGVFHDTVTELTKKCGGGKNLHLWRLQRVAKAFDSVKYFYSSVEPDLQSYDVLVFDRYLFTHYAAGMGRYHHDPYSRELLKVFPPADMIYLLDVPVEELLKRLATRGELTVDENRYMLTRYRHALLDLGARHGFMVLDGLKPFEENRERILKNAGRLAVSRGLIDE